MSSINRSILGSKESNIDSVSPTKSAKSRSSSSSPFKSSPSKRTRVSPTKFIPKSNPIAAKPSKPIDFTIYEDACNKTIKEFNDLEVSGKENSSSEQSKSKYSFNEQENILQPKYKYLPQQNLLVRKPLMVLNPNEFKGFLMVNDTVEQLTEPFVPKTFKNESNTIHKFHNGMPSYVSPMKSSKFLFKSSAIKETEFNDDDELEHNLLRKLLLIKRNKFHKRSFSLGKNDLKHDLIKKNGFTILTN